jgi:N-acetyltransferase
MSAPDPHPFDPQPTLVGTLLTMRPMVPADHDALFAVASDPLIWEQHPARTRYEPEVFRVFFDEGIATGGALVAIEAATGDIIGSSRFFGYDAERREVEVGWSFLARRFWGGRYNGEMKALMCGHAFQWCDRVLFLIGPNNWRSRRAVERIGAVFVEIANDPPRGERAVYALSNPTH